MSRKNSCLVFPLVLLLLTQCASVLAQQSVVGESRSSSTENSITGRVINEAGQPVSNAAIYAQSAGTTGQRRSVSTDGDGRFQLSGLERGAYIIWTYLPGYVDENSLAQPWPQRYYRPGDVLTLTMVKGGVITGTVTNAAGEPLVAIGVHALRVRDAQGHSIKDVPNYSRERLTDDRGIYRIFGLVPGSYLVYAGGRTQGLPDISPYDKDAPTYAPSSARDTAQEIAVRGGEEAAGVDIRYRGEPGYALSGKVKGVSRTDSRSTSVSVMLMHAASRQIEASTYLNGNFNESTFAFYGVPDDTYYLLARQYGVNGDAAAATPARITVKGANVGGIELSLASLGSISGRFNVEVPKDVECADNRAGLLRETVIITRRLTESATTESPSSSLTSTFNAIPGDDGVFAFRGLDAGRYYFEVRLPGDGWYLRTLNLPVQAAGPKSPASLKTNTAAADVARQGLLLKPGEQAANLTMTLTAGAATLSGHILPAREGERGPANLHVHLIPAEREAIDDVLRYAETLSDSHGEFTLKNIAPGRYWLLARVPSETEFLMPYKPAAWDSAARTKLHEQAEAANNKIDLQACQRRTDATLLYK
jgi:protocatechuate 3,4-dioxygenase beta subunit